MIDTLIILLGCSYLFYKFYKSKKTGPLYTGIIVLLFQLSKWPFYMPTLMAFSLMAFACGGMLFYEYYYKRKDKSAIIFTIMFFCFGIIFFAKNLLFSK